MTVDAIRDRLDKAAAEAHKAARRANAGVHDAADAIEGAIEEHPFTSILIALGRRFPDRRIHAPLTLARDVRDGAESLAMTMGNILRKLLWMAAVSRGAGEMKVTLRRARRRAVLIALGSALALTGCGFLLAAVFIALAGFVGELRACLIVGAALALVGGCFLLYATRRQRPSAEPSDHRAVNHRRS